MNQEKQNILSLSILLARLGFTELDISVLMSAGLLKLLRHPPASGSKYFATVEPKTLRNNLCWLAKASDAIGHNWRKKHTGCCWRMEKPSAIEA